MSTASPATSSAHSPCANGANIARQARNHVAEIPDSKDRAREEKEISSLLCAAVLKLWRDERQHGNNGKESVQAHANQASAEHLNGRDGFALQTITCKKEVPETPNRVLPLPRLPLWKRVLDVSFILLTAPVWLPLMCVLMLAVRLSSPGPIFYRQERVGFFGRPFMIYKFRSMKVNSETRVHEAHFERLMTESVPMVKLDGGDPRIIKWGRVLRATGLDELPQIFNVLRGEMSLVGPRPCTVHEFSRYTNWQKERVQAVPGLTGYWQVNGKNKTTFNEMIEMDIYYSKHVSLGLDLQILLQTFPALLEQTLDTFGRRRPRLAPLPQDVKARA